MIGGKTMLIPENLKYTKEHEWVAVDGTVATIGITAYAAQELGDIVFVDIDTTPRDLASGETGGSIEAVKTVSDLFAPCAGKLTEVNEALKDTPEVVNSDPYEAGWMYRCEIADQAEIDGLLTPAQYKELIGE